MASPFYPSPNPAPRPSRSASHGYGYGYGVPVNPSSLAATRRRQYDYQFREQEAADKAALKAREDQEKALRQAEEDAYKEALAQQKVAGKAAVADAKADKAAQNNAREAEYRRQKRPMYVDADGFIQPVHSDEEWQGQQAQQARNAELKEQYFKQGRPSMVNGAGDVVTRHSDQEWQAMQDAKAAEQAAKAKVKADKAYQEKEQLAIDDQQAVLDENDRSIARHGQELKLHADTVKRELMAKIKPYRDYLDDVDKGNIMPRHDEPTLQRLRNQLKAWEAEISRAEDEHRQWEAGKLAFDREQDALRADIKAQERRVPTLEAPVEATPAVPAKPVTATTPMGVRAPGQQPEVRKEAQAVPGLRTQVLGAWAAGVARNEQLSPEQKREAVNQLAARRDPAMYEEQQRQRYATLDTPTLRAEIERESATLQTRVADYNQRLAVLNASAGALEQEMGGLQARNEQRLSEPHRADELVTLRGPDGQAQTWFKDLARDYLDLQGRAKQWQDENQAQADLLDVEAEELERDERLLQEGAQLHDERAAFEEAAQRQQQEAQRQAAVAEQRARRMEQLGSLEKAGHGKHAAALRALDAEVQQRLDEIEKRHAPGSPEEEAALEALQADISTKEERIGSEIDTAENRQREKLYAELNALPGSRGLGDRLQKLDEEVRPHLGGDDAGAQAYYQEQQQAIFAQARKAAEQAQGEARRIYGKLADKLFELEVQEPWWARGDEGRMASDPDQALTAFGRESTAQVDAAFDDAVEELTGALGGRAETPGVMGVPVRSAERQQAINLLRDLRANDWSSGDTETPVRYDSRGQVLVNPKLWQDEAGYRQAVESSEASPESKAAALQQAPELRQRAADAQVETLRRTGLFRDWEARQKDAGQVDNATLLARFEKEHQGMFSAGAWRARRDQAVLGVASGVIGLAQSAVGVVEALTSSRRAMDAYKELSRAAGSLGTASAALPTGQWTHMGTSMLVSSAPSLAVGGLAGEGRRLALNQAAKRLPLKQVLANGTKIAGLKTAEQAAKAAESFGLKSAAAAAGLQTFGTMYGNAVQAYRERGLGDQEALNRGLVPALAAGVSTFLLTAAGGTKGVEALLRQPSFKQNFAQWFKAAASGGLQEGLREEAPDQLIQGMLERHSFNPRKTWGEIAEETLVAGIGGAVLGAGFEGLNTPVAPRGEVGSGLPSLAVVGDGLTEPEPSIERAAEADRSVGAPLDAVAQRPETGAAARAAIEAFDDPSMKPQTLEDTKAKAGVVLDIAQGAKLEDLTDEQLRLVGLNRDGTPGHYENAPVDKKDPGQGLRRVWSKGPRKDGFQPVVVEDGQLIITQRQIDNLRQRMPAVADAIGQSEVERRRALRAVGDGLPSLAVVGDGLAGRDATLEERTPNDEGRTDGGAAGGAAEDAGEEGVLEAAAAGAAAPRGGQAVESPAEAELTGIVDGGELMVDRPEAGADRSVRAPVGLQDDLSLAEEERAEQLAFALSRRGLTDAEALQVARGVVRRMGVVGDNYNYQYVDPGFDEAMKAEGWVRDPAGGAMRWVKRGQFAAETRAQKPVMRPAEKVGSGLPSLAVVGDGSQSGEPGAESEESAPAAVVASNATNGTRQPEADRSVRAPVAEEPQAGVDPAREAMMRKLQRMPLQVRPDWQQGLRMALGDQVKRLQQRADRKVAGEQFQKMQQAALALQKLVDGVYGKLFDRVIVARYPVGGGMSARTLAEDAQGRATEVALVIDPVQFLEAGPLTDVGIDKMLDEEAQHRADLMVSSRQEGIDLARAIHAARPGVFNTAWKAYHAFEISESQKKGLKPGDDGYFPPLPPRELNDDEAFKLYFEASRMIRQGNLPTEIAEFPDVIEKIAKFLKRFVKWLRDEIKRLPKEIREEWQVRLDQAEALLVKMRQRADAAERGRLEQQVDSRELMVDRRTEPSVEDELGAAADAMLEEETGEEPRAESEEAEADKSVRAPVEKPKAKPRTKKQRKAWFWDMLQAYYEPGAIVPAAYGPGYEKVLKLEDSGGVGDAWRVQVQEVDAEGQAVPGTKPRWHSTRPPEGVLQTAWEDKQAREGLAAGQKRVQGGGMATPDGAAQNAEPSPGGLSEAEVDEGTGLPLNADGTVTVYHGTTSAAAEAIRSTGVIRSAAEPRIYFTSAKEGTGYGDGTVVALDINPALLELDDEFPDGRKDFAVEVGSRRQLNIKIHSNFSRAGDGTLAAGAKRSWSAETKRVQDAAIDGIFAALYGKDAAEKSPALGDSGNHGRGLGALAAAWLQRESDSAGQGPAAGMGGRAGSESSKREQGAVLADWARENGLLLTRLPAEYQPGSEDDVGAMEHHTWESPDGKRFVKLTKDGNFGLWPVVHGDGWDMRAADATPLHYLERLNLANSVFGDDWVLHGVLVNRQGRVQILTSQPNYHGELPDDRVNDAPENEEQQERERQMDAIAAAMRTQGFQRVGRPWQNTYYRAADNTAVFDAHLRNVMWVESAAGEDLVPFDVVVMKPLGRLRERLSQGLGSGMKRSFTSALGGDLARAAQSVKGGGAAEEALPPADQREMLDLDEAAERAAAFNAKDAATWPEDLREAWEEGMQDIEDALEGGDAEAFYAALPEALKDREPRLKEWADPAKSQRLEVLRRKGSEARERLDRMDEDTYWSQFPAGRQAEFQRLGDADRQREFRRLQDEVWLRQHSGLTAVELAEKEGLEDADSEAIDWMESPAARKLADDAQARLLGELQQRARARAVDLRRQIDATGRKRWNVERSAFEDTPAPEIALGNEKLPLEDAEERVEAYRTDPEDTEAWPAELRKAYEADPRFADLAEDPYQVRDWFPKEWAAKIERSNALDALAEEDALPAADEAEQERPADEITSEWEDAAATHIKQDYLPRVKAAMNTAAAAIEATGRKKWDGGKGWFVDTDEPQVLFGAAKRKTVAGPEADKSVRAPVDELAHEAATSPRNDLPEPTEAQKAAGNYQKGHVRIGGHEISIENPAGSKRRPEWPALQDHYGYFKGTNAKADGDHVDVFVKPGTPADYDGPVHIVRQNVVERGGPVEGGELMVDSQKPNPEAGRIARAPVLRATGRFDEYKVMLGYLTAEEARAAYLRNYEPGWPGLGKMTTHSMREFGRLKEALFQVRTQGQAMPGVRESEAVLAAGQKRGQGGGMATPDGAAQNEEPSPGGLSEAEGGSRILYHGNTPAFGRFAATPLGIHLGPEEAARERVEQTGQNNAHIKRYRVTLKNPVLLGYDPGTWMANEVFEALPQGIQKQVEDSFPYVIEDLDLEDLKSELQKLGFDGIEYPNAFEGGAENSVLVFDQSQIQDIPESSRAEGGTLASAAKKGPPVLTEEQYAAYRKALDAGETVEAEKIMAEAKRNKPKEPSRTAKALSATARTIKKVDRSLLKVVGGKTALAEGGGRAGAGAAVGATAGGLLAGPAGVAAGAALGAALAANPKLAGAVFTTLPSTLAVGAAKAGATVVNVTGLQKPLALFGSNTFDKLIYQHVMKPVVWDRVGSAKESVVTWLGKPGAFNAVARGILNQAVPTWNTPREWLALLHEMQRKTAWGRETAMDVVRALSHDAKVSDLAYPKEYVEDPKWRVMMFDAMEGQRPMSDLPEPLQKLAGRLRKLLEDTGRELVRQGLLSTDTFEELRSNGWMPRFTEDEAEAAGGSWLKAFQLGIKEIGQQRSTAWHIVDTTRKDPKREGEYATITYQDGGKRNRWRFRSQQHRDGFYEDFVRREAVRLLKEGGPQVTNLLAALPRDAAKSVRDEIRGLTRESLDLEATLSPNLRNVVRRAIELQRVRYKKEAPYEPEKLIKDPVYAVARYVLAQTHNAATMELLRETAKRSDWVSDVAVDGFRQMPDNPRFGPLEKQWVRNDIAEQVLQQVGMTGAVMQFYDSLLRKWKGGKLVLNPGSHVRDAVGNVVFAFLGGSNPFNPGNLPYYRDALTTLRDGGDRYAELIEYGVLGGDAYSNEVRTALRGLLPDTKTVENLDTGLFQRLMAGFGAGVREGYQWASEVRQIPDNVYKSAAYFKYRDMGMEPKDAAEEVRKWFPFYDRLGTSPLLRGVGRLQNPFASFWRESTRILGRAAMERPLALAGSLSFAYGVTQLSLLMLGLGQDDEEAVFRGMRGKLTLGASGDTPVFAMLLPMRTSEGQLQQWDISAVMPFADLLGSRVEMRPGENAWTKFWRERFTASPILSTAWAWSTNEDPFSGRRITQDDMGPLESAKEVGKDFLGDILPPLTPWVGVHANTLAQAGRRTSNLEMRNKWQSYIRAVVGLDVRSAAPNLRTETDYFRKKNNLPLEPAGSSFPTPLKARLGREIKDELIQDEQDIDRIAEAMARLEASGNPIRTPKQMMDLLDSLDPTRIIKKALRQRLIQSFSPEAQRVYEGQVKEFQHAQKRAPATLAEIRRRQAS